MRLCVQLRWFMGCLHMQGCRVCRHHGLFILPCGDASVQLCTSCGTLACGSVHSLCVPAYEAWMQIDLAAESARLCSKRHQSKR